MSWSFLLFIGYLYGNGIRLVAKRIARTAPFYLTFSLTVFCTKRNQSWLFRAIPIVFGFFFVLGRFKFGLGISFYFFIILSTYFILLSLYDIYYFLLPDYLTLSLFLFGFLVSYFNGITQTIPIILLTSSFLFISLFSINILFYLYRHEYGIGLGDIKLLMALSSWFSPLEIIHILILSTSSALIWIIIIWFVKRKTLLKIPFGPFILFGAWIILIYN